MNPLIENWGRKKFNSLSREQQSEIKELQKLTSLQWMIGKNSRQITKKSIDYRIKNFGVFNTLTTHVPRYALTAWTQEPNNPEHKLRISSSIYNEYLLVYVEFDTHILPLPHLCEKGISLLKELKIPVGMPYQTARGTSMWIKIKSPKIKNLLNIKHHNDQVEKLNKLVRKISEILHNNNGEFLGECHGKVLTFSESNIHCADLMKCPPSTKYVSNEISWEEWQNLNLSLELLGEFKETVQIKCNSGSNARTTITEDDLLDYEPMMNRINKYYKDIPEYTSCTDKTKRRKIGLSVFSQYTFLLLKCKPNKDGTFPIAMIKSAWEAMVNEGLFKGSYQSSIFSTILEYWNSKNAIVWEDSSYTIGLYVNGEKVSKGTARKFSFCPNIKNLLINEEIKCEIQETKGNSSLTSLNTHTLLGITSSGSYCPSRPVWEWIDPEEKISQIVLAC